MDFIRVVLDEGAFEPTRSHPFDAGLDFRTPYDIEVPSMGQVVINTGIHIEVPEGYEGKMESRSGLFTKHGIICMGGVIDTGFTGAVKVSLFNLSQKDYKFKKGDRIAQLVLHKIEVPIPVAVDSLADSARGSSGFGSTGR